MGRSSPYRFGRVGTAALIVTCPVLIPAIALGLAITAGWSAAVDQARDLPEALRYVLKGAK